MISWMQKHKKWLIVTIWISTIAFVGAGFVGWGSYDYGKSNSTVAIVNDKEVPLTDLQNEYSTLYSQYQQMFGESFNQELAKQLKLEEAALQRVTQKYLFINYAEELGLVITDKEVAKELVKITAFYKDGKFDKTTYMSVLKQNRRTVAEFEEQLKKDLLVSKVQKVFNTELSKNETKNLGSLLYAQDKVSVMVLNKNKISVTAKESEIEKFWEENKDNYKSEKGINIEFSKVETIENKDKKAMKKVALKKYLALKKDKEKFEETKTIYNNLSFLNQEDYKNLSISDNGTTLKPIYINNNYYIIKKIDQKKPTTLSYEDVKKQVRDQYTEKLKNDLLIEETNKAKSNFNGINLGYILRDSKPYIKGLSEEDTKQFVQHVFNSNTTINSIDLANKTIVYKIVDTKLATYDAKNNETIKSIFTNIKNNSLSNSLLEQLTNKYQVRSFMGTK